MAAAWAERLAMQYARLGHPICVGLDPRIERVPHRTGDVERDLLAFFLPMLAAFAEAASQPAALKPNIAYFAQYGLPGLRALDRICAFAREQLQSLLLLDAKRGDIGPSALAYAREAFDAWGADAVTVAPYLGGDCVGTFIDHAAGRGVYVLVRTSNPSAGDLQDLPVGGEAQPLYAKVANWLAATFPDAGAVVGATDPVALGKAASLLRGHPLLIPGVGTQGGQISDVYDAIDVGEHPTLLVSASSSILYAYESTGDAAGFAEHARAALSKLIREWQVLAAESAASR